MKQVQCCALRRSCQAEAVKTAGSGCSIAARRFLPQSGGLVLPERAGSWPGLLCVPVVGVNFQGIHRPSLPRDADYHWVILVLPRASYRGG